MRLNACLIGSQNVCSKLARSDFRYRSPLIFLNNYLENHELDVLITNK